MNRYIPLMMTVALSAAISVPHVPLLDDRHDNSPLHQGRPKRSGIYTKRYADSRQRRFQKNRQKRRW